MYFENSSPLLLQLLLAAVLAVLLVRARWAGKRRQCIENLGEQRLRAVTLPLSEALLSGSFWIVSSALLSVFFLALAALRPQFGFTWVDRPAGGADIVIALDLSSSMKVRDVLPDRLERAKREILDLLPSLKGNRVALATFAGASFLELPLTRDVSTFKVFLDSADPDLMPSQGTNLSSAIRRSLGALHRGTGGSAGEEEESPGGKSSRSRSILLVTDGEDFGSGAEAALAELKTEGVTLYVLGVGTPQGGPIPEGNTYKKNNGTTVVSKLQPDLLTSLARQGGGDAVIAEPGDSDTQALAARLVTPTAARGEQTIGKKQVPNEYFQVPLFLGVVFFLLLCILEKRRALGKVKRRERLHPAPAAAILLLGLTAADANALDVEREGDNARRLYDDGSFESSLDKFSEAGAETPEDPRFALGKGASFYRLKRFSDAAKEFLRAAEKGQTPEEKASSLYNAGNSLAMGGDLESAVKAYEGSLSLNPDDTDAQENLEYVKRLLQQKQEQQQENKQQEQKKENEKNQDKNEQEKNKDEQSSGGKSDQEKKEEEEQQSQDKKDDQQKEQDQQGSQGSKPENEKPQEEKQQQQSGQGEKEDEEQNAGKKKEEKEDKQNGAQQQQPQGEGKENDEQERQQQNAAQGKTGTPKEQGEDPAQSPSRPGGDNPFADAMLNGIQENRGALLEYRRQKAEEGEPGEAQENGVDW